MRQTGLQEPNPQKGVQILLQILKPLSDTEILTSELVGDQIECFPPFFDLLLIVLDHPVFASVYLKIQRCESY